MCSTSCGFVASLINVCSYSPNIPLESFAKLNISSNHLLLGLWLRLFAFSCGSSDGSHRNARIIHSEGCAPATFWNHLHFRRRCNRTQSSMRKSRRCLSASRVHRLIHSAQDSNSRSSLSSDCARVCAGEGSLVTSLPLSVCSDWALLGVRGVLQREVGGAVVAVRLRGQCMIIRNI